MSFFARLLSVNALFAAFLICAGPAWAQLARPDIADRPSVDAAVPELVLAESTATAAVQLATIKSASKAPEVIRSRHVALDHSVLKSLRADASASRPQSIRISFFDDTSLTVDITRIDSIGTTGKAFRGTVRGVANSSAVLVENAGVISGNINILNDRYQIRNFGDAGHVMRQIDVTALPPDHMAMPTGPETTVPVSPAKMRSTGEAAINTAFDDGSIIDVMVVYTPAARISQGGTNAMKSLIDLGIADTNAAYANSGVTQRIRLVYAGEVNYQETNLIADLARLQGIADGFMDEVHELRNLYGADVVSLWGNYSAGCGQANLMTTEEAGFANLAFNVVERNCATSNYSFAHELGHNMGLQHDVFDGNAGTIVTPEGSITQTSINYAHGHVDLNNRFRSIMAISAQCDTQSPAVNCPRIPYFSNPGVSFDNRANFPGASASASTGSPSAQESRALNDTRDTTANFRAAVNLAGPGTVIFSPATYAVIESAASITLFATRHAGTAGAVSVNFSTVAGTANAGTDYTARSGVLAWASGESGSKSITVPVLQDGVPDGPKTFSVSLNGPTGGVSIGVPGGSAANAVVNISDADNDNFPPNCMMPLTGWTTSGTGWGVATDTFFGLNCSLRSNPTPDGGSARIQFEGNFTTGTVSFARRVSSQAGNDCLKFLIDGVAQNLGGACNGVGIGGASGEVAWGQVSFPIAAGAHTLIWSYEKDAAGAAGADAAWIDSVVLPLGGPPLIQSAPPIGGFLNIPYSHSYISTGSPAISYSLLAQTLPNGLTLNAANGVISGTPAALGTFTGFVRASNGQLPVAQQPFSITIIGVVPDPPVIGTAVPDNGRATIAFTRPVSVGSADISSYTVTCNPGAISATGADSPIVVADLMNGSEYGCAVTAANIYGTSGASATVLVTPAPTKPSAPTIAAVIPANGRAFVAFTPPLSDGGATITNYTATCNPGAITGSAFFSPITVNGLSNGIAYTCSVTATNSVGASIASAASALVTPAPAATLALVSVVSRKTHGLAGDFELPIDTTQPFTGAVTVEPRMIGGGHTVVFKFNSSVNAPGAVSVRDETSATVNASSIASGADVVVTIPAIADKKRIAITLIGVNGGLDTSPATIGFLTGDVDNSRTVTTLDVASIKARAGLAATVPNFKFDVNLSGSVTAADISIAKARSGLSLP